jgi:penicillin amidase
MALAAGFAIFGKSFLSAQALGAPSLATRAELGVAQHDGDLAVPGLHHPVEVLRDNWGIPHIYAQDTHDLFFAQGFVVAQDRMWQLEMWRRNAEGRLAEVLGPQYVQRDEFARTLAFRGDWNKELRRYQPEGPVIFSAFAFADGVNAAIELALSEGKVPVEFQLMGFQPQPVWTAKTLLTRMPGWTLSRNASSELARALAIKAFGVEKAQQLISTTPEKKVEIPAGLDLDDIVPQILDIARNANDLHWKFKPAVGGNPTAGGGLAELENDLDLAPAGELAFDADSTSELGSNNWVVGGSKSATGMPLLANDPHREVVNPSLRELVHLVAPGWDDIGATEPGLPGITIGHNEDVAWGFTILGVDQQDIYVEETDPSHPDRYMYKGQWLTMTDDKQVIHVKGKPSVIYDVKTTIHGPVLYEDHDRHRTFALRWVGAEVGGAGYLGSLNVMQAKNWDEFNEDLAKAWYLPSHSLVYADTKGNYGYIAAALTPIRKNWDGLLPVPGKDGTYEWDGFLPFSQLPKEKNGAKGFYASANNDVVPRIFPNYKTPLGYEYGAPFRYDRIVEVLSQNKKFTIQDFENLQFDHTSLPARELVPLLKGLKSDKPDVQAAIDKLLAWNDVVDKDAATPTIYEYWLMKLTPLVYAPHIPENMRDKFRRYNVDDVIEWVRNPDKDFGPDPKAARNQILLTALEEALADLHQKYGDDESKWVWGDIHKATFEHPLLTEATKSIFAIDPIRRGGDAYTVQATSSPTEGNTDQESGASAMYVFDVQDWDRSVGLNTPGNAADAGDPHYDDLAPLWGSEKYFPLAFSRKKVEEVTKDRLMLYPLADNEAAEPNAAFERAETDLFTEEKPVVAVWGDYDGDGYPDLFVGYSGGMVKLFHNDGNGKFHDVSLEAGITDSNEVRAACWGDFDGDGKLDLYLGFAASSTTPNRLYHNDGNGHFTDVAEKMGVADSGETRQCAFIDFNNDGRVDLFVAFRDKPPTLYRNDGDHFTEVAEQMGITGADNTVGVVWFDYNEDGRLDMFEANQNGKPNKVYRNDGDHFTEVAKELGLDGGTRTVKQGSISIAVGDYNNDGRLDLFYANSGQCWLMRNDGGGKFTDVAPQMGLAIDRHEMVAAGWADYGNEGRPDLYVDGYISGEPNIRDYLFHNDGDHFTDMTPGYMLKHDGDHAVSWGDYELNGAMDLAVASNAPGELLTLWHNLLSPERAHRSLNVLVLDSKGHYTQAGAEVRLYAAGTRHVLGTNIVDSGSSYDGQSELPVHFGLPNPGKVDVEVTSMSNTGRKITRVADVDPATLNGKPLVVRTNVP